MEIIGLDKTIETTTFEGTLEDMEDRIIEENIETIGAMNTNRGRNRSRERTFLRNRDRSSSNSKSKSGPQASTNRDRIRCYNCREYDHFVRDCPILEKKETYSIYNRC